MRKSCKRFTILVVFIFVNSMVINAQTIQLSLGQTQTSTSFRTSEFMFFGNYLLATPKQGWAGEIDSYKAFDEWLKD